VFCVIPLWFWRQLCLILVTNGCFVQGWRHSFQAYFRLYNLETRSDVGWLTPAGQELLQNVVFAPTADETKSFVAFVRSNDVFLTDIVSKSGTQVPVHLCCLMRDFPVDNAEARVTSTGSFTILNGVASWEYEEEIFGSSLALWWSPQSSYLAYATVSVACVSVTCPRLTA
jgi:dipeptidyl aminopeptidase B